MYPSSTAATWNDSVDDILSSKLEPNGYSMLSRVRSRIPRVRTSVTDTQSQKKVRRDKPIKQNHTQLSAIRNQNGESSIAYTYTTPPTIYLPHSYATLRYTVFYSNDAVHPFR